MTEPRILGFNALSLISGLASAVIVYSYIQNKFWMLNNYFAISFSVYAIEKWSLLKFWQVLLAFACLIAYDVYFVYHSDVMMTVATNFETPMKILIYIGPQGFSMIGIGDIIVPGLLVSMCLRADFIRSLLIKALRGDTMAQIEGEEETRYYFRGSIISYGFGLVLTIAVLMFTKEP